MPRSITRPQTGSTVWYFATPGAAVQAAMVTKKVDNTHMNLSVFPVAGGPAVAQAGVLFVDAGTRPASGAFCTYMRVNEPLLGAYPSGDSEPSEYAMHDLTQVERDFRQGVT